MLFCAICVFCLLVVLVRLSVPQCLKLTEKTYLLNDLQCVDGDVKPYSLTHPSSRQCHNRHGYDTYMSHKVVSIIIDRDRQTDRQTDLVARVFNAFTQQCWVITVIRHPRQAWTAAVQEDVLAPRVSVVVTEDQRTSANCLLQVLH